MSRLCGAASLLALLAQRWLPLRPFGERRSVAYARRLTRFSQLQKKWDSRATRLEQGEYIMFTRSVLELTIRIRSSAGAAAFDVGVHAGTRKSGSLSRAIREALHGAVAPASDARWVAASIASIAALTAIATPRVSLSAVPVANALVVRAGDGSEGFVAVGEEFDGSAVSVSGAGDVNGDGVDDVLIGATEADPHSRFQAGVSYVVFGRNTAQSGNFPALFPLPGLLPGGGGDGSQGFVLEGVSNAASLGASVSDAGDVNDDGIDDVIVGSPSADPDGRSAAGESYVVFGSTAGFPATLDMLRLRPGGGGDGSRGFVLKGVHEFDSSGASVSSAGDVNGDGIDDVIIGAPRADPHGHASAGESFVVFGRATGFPGAIELADLFSARGGDGSAGFVLKGREAIDSAGISVSNAGDVNGDGIDDIVIGALYAGPEPDQQFPPGAAYVVFGRTTGFPPEFELRTLLQNQGGDGSEGVVLICAASRDFCGTSVSGAGDVNGDGIDDLIIGGPGNFIYGHPGHSYVVFGRTTGFPATIALRTLLPANGGDGSEGFVLTGIDVYDFAGHSVSRAGDVNGDGIDDLLIGAYGADADPSKRRMRGESFVLFGRTTGFPAALSLGSLFPAAGGDGSEGFVLMGTAIYDRSGYSVSDAGDVNGDGIEDLLVGSPAAIFSDQSYNETYVVFGRTSGFPAVFELGSLLPPP